VLRVRSSRDQRPTPFVPSLVPCSGGFTPSQPSPIKGEGFTQLALQVIREAVEIV
jgi:hypothetical protein